MKSTKGSKDMVGVVILNSLTVKCTLYITNCAKYP